MEHYDAIVLGAGGVGGAALYHLARRGVRAIGIDRFHPPHDRGSTHGHTRVIRRAYFEHPDYVPLLIDSYRLWHELEWHLGRQLFYPVGLIQVGRADGHVVPGVLRSAGKHGLEVEQLTAKSAEQRWPGLRVPEGLDCVFEPDAGYLLVEDSVRAHLDAAHDAGARLLLNTEVQSWHAADGQVRVQTTSGDFAAERLIIAAGSWASQSLAWVVPDLVIRRKSLFWFETSHPAYEVTAGFPVFLFELPEGVFYGFPNIDAHGVKVAEHTGGRVVEQPQAVDRNIDLEEARRVTNFLSAHLPNVSSTIAEHAVCLYTMSPDEHFIVDRHPHHPNVFFAAGLSGHGFKFVPVLGRALAELALDDATKLPLGFLSLERFTQQR